MALTHRSSGSASGDGDDPPRSPARSASIAAVVITACFCVHATNGLIVERLFLGFHSYTDYADVDKLGRALGSAPWLASGVAHLVTGVAVVVLGVNLAQVIAPRRARLAEYLRYATGVAAVGFTMLGVADVQGSQTVKLLADQNPELRRTAYLALSIVVPVANGVAITAFGWMMLIVARYAQGGLTGLPRWYMVLSYVAGASGLLLGLAYVPVYLLLFLAWCWCTAVLFRHGGPVSLSARLAIQEP